MYKPKSSYEYRPDTRKIYLEYYKMEDIPVDHQVHHILPVRLGGTHDISNLILLNRLDHANAHLELYKRFLDIKDLCAYHMIIGNTVEAHLIACSKGGKQSQIDKKLRGELNGFQLFDKEKRKLIASKAGIIGGNKQVKLKLGIHTTDINKRIEWARLGGYASIEANGFNDSNKQSERGKRGGPKNKGFKWYNDGINDSKYTTMQIKSEQFEDFLKRTGMKPGRCKSIDFGSKFYNDGVNHFMFRPSDHLESFEEFLTTNQFNKGRLKNEN